MKIGTQWMALWLVGLVGTACGGDAAMDAGGAEPANAEITNNQVDGVDEGGIVKNIGDHLVVLRRGELFAIDVADSGAANVTDSTLVPGEGLSMDAWYDEMLVDGDHIYVVGYRWDVKITNEISGGYWRGATELNHFQLTDDGKIQRREALFFESSDYYDWSNYASRRIDDKLVFYVPYYHQRGIFSFLKPGKVEARLPTMLEHQGGNRFERVESLLDSGDIEKFDGGGQIVHTIVTCDLSGGEVKRCSAKGLRGDYWTQRYVGAEDVFLWGVDRVYAMSLEDGSVTAHSARGWAIDQFSFDYDGENFYALVSVWDERNDVNKLELLTLPRKGFDKKGNQNLDRHVSALSSDDQSWVSSNRWVDGHILYATSVWDERTGQHTFQTVAHDRATGTSTTLATGSVTRIEPMRGLGALVVSNDEAGLVLHSVSFDDGVRISDSLRIDAVREGEHRSHGFFFKPDDDLDGGRFGLPTLNGGWNNEGADIMFVDVDANLGMDVAGQVSTLAAPDDDCKVSCADWYGNTRPIFLRDRVYALMGSELVEVSFDDGMSEVQRIILD